MNRRMETSMVKLLKNIYSINQHKTKGETTLVTFNIETWRLEFQNWEEACTLDVEVTMQNMPTKTGYVHIKTSYKHLDRKDATRRNKTS